MSTLTTSETLSLRGHLDDLRAEALLECKEIHDYRARYPKGFYDTSFAQEKIFLANAFLKVLAALDQNMTGFGQLPELLDTEV